jgi:hypothetical protein
MDMGRFLIVCVLAVFFISACTEQLATPNQSTTETANKPGVVEEELIQTGTEPATKPAEANIAKTEQPINEPERAAEEEKFTLLEGESITYQTKDGNITIKFRNIQEDKALLTINGVDTPLDLNQPLVFNKQAELTVTQAEQDAATEKQGSMVRVYIGVGGEIIRDTLMEDQAKTYRATHVRPAFIGIASGGRKVVNFVINGRPINPLGEDQDYSEGNFYIRVRDILYRPPIEISKDRVTIKIKPAR